MKKTVRKKIVRKFPYGLHDSHINHIKVKEKKFPNAKVKFLFDDGYYVIRNGEALPVQGNLSFEKVDLDFSNVYIMKISKTNYGKIEGRKYSLKKFAKKFPNVDMEIIDTTFDGYHCKLSGYLYKKGKIYEFLMEICYLGDMIYKTKE